MRIFPKSFNCFQFCNSKYSINTQSLPFSALCKGYCLTRGIVCNTHEDIYWFNVGLVCTILSSSFNILEYRSYIANRRRRITVAINGVMTTIKLLIKRGWNRRRAAFHFSLLYFSKKVLSTMEESGRVFLPSIKHRTPYKPYMHVTFVRYR